MKGPSKSLAISRGSCTSTFQKESNRQESLYERKWTMSSPSISEKNNNSESRPVYLEQEVSVLKQKLAQVEKDRDEYLQNVSHQIVAPLNAMKWHIENLTNARVS